MAAIDAVASIRSAVAPVLQVCEVRAIAADSLWLSPNYERDSVALHFTWIADTEAVLPVVAQLEQVLAPLNPRPHWGKIFTMSPSWVRAAFPRFADFQDLVRRYDPAGVCRNLWLSGILG